LSSLDIGCGWTTRQVKRGLIGIDLHRGSCDIVADAYHLPFSNNQFSSVYLWAVLEHLDNPLSALNEAKRVVVSDGLITVMVPFDSNVWRVLLKRLVIEFPLGFVLAVETLLRLRKLWRVPGARHKRQIPLSFLADNLKIVSVKKIGWHYWLTGKHGKLLRQLMKGRSLVNYDFVVEGKA
jgi:SAM-dependent methyltransferase